MEYDDGYNDLCYDYFNLTDEDMAKDHIWDDKLYPKCTSTDANYFYKNNTVVTRNQVEKLLSDRLRNEEVVIHIKITDYKADNFNVKSLMSKLINSRFHKASRVTWNTNDVQGVIKVTFEYD
jgi:hypothetical protein